MQGAGAAHRTGVTAGGQPGCPLSGWMPAGSTRGGVAPLITTAASLQAPLPPPAQLPTLHTSTLDPGSPLAPPLRSGTYHRWCRRVWRRRRRRRWWSWWPPIGPRLAERKGAGEVSSLLSGHRERGVEEVVESAGGDRSARRPNPPSQTTPLCPISIVQAACGNRPMWPPVGVDVDVRWIHVATPCMLAACSLPAAATPVPSARHVSVPNQFLTGDSKWDGRACCSRGGRVNCPKPPHHIASLGLGRIWLSAEAMAALREWAAIGSWPPATSPTSNLTCPLGTGS